MDEGEPQITDAAGRFELRRPAGLCHVGIVAGGYLAYQAQIDLRAGEVVESAFHLTPRIDRPFETVITGKVRETAVVPVGLGREEMGRIPGTFSDPIRVVESLPGVARAPFGLGLLVVRGASPLDTATFIDDVPIPLLFHFGGGPSVVNPEFVERLDFYPGGFGPRYGRAVGGVVALASRRPEAERFRAALGVDLLAAHAFAAAPFGDGGSAAAARRSYADAVAALVLGAAGASRTVLAPAYWDYQLRVDRSPKGSRHALTLTVFGSDDALRAVSAGGESQRAFALYAHAAFTRLRAAWTYRGDSWRFGVAPHFGLDAVSFDLVPNTFRREQVGGGVRADASRALAGGHVARAGLDIVGGHARYETSLLLPPSYRNFPGGTADRPQPWVDRRVDQLCAAAYAETQATLGRLEMTPGLRAELCHLHGQTMPSLEPRLSARLAITPDAALTGTVGLYRQPPPPEALDPLAGNPNVGYASALQTSLGVEARVGDRLNAAVTAFFHRRFDELVVLDRVTVGPDGRPVRLLVGNEGIARSYGVEVMLRHEVTARSFGWVSYTLSRSEARRRGEPLYAPTTFDQTHVLTAAGRYRLGAGFAAGVRFRLATGVPTTAVLGSTFDADLDGYVPLQGEPGSERLPTFHQLDLRVDKVFTFDWWTLTVYVEILNVYNARNVEAVQWGYRFRDREEIPGLPVLPMLGLKGEY